MSEYTGNDEEKQNPTEEQTPTETGRKQNNPGDEEGNGEPKPEEKQ